MTVDLDFQQSLSQLFTLLPYGQLILEQAELAEVEPDIVDLVFETLVRDFTRHGDRAPRQGLLDGGAAGAGRSTASASRSSTSFATTASTPRSGRCPAPT